MIIAGSCPHCGKPLGINMNIEALNIMSSDSKEREDKIRAELDKIKGRQQLDQAIQTIGTAPLGAVDRYERFTVSQSQPKKRKQPIYHNKKEEFDEAKATLEAHYANKQRNKEIRDSQKSM